VPWATEREWRWCGKCQGLWSENDVSNRVCPGGGDHIKTGSDNYSVVKDATGTPGEPQWRRCVNCSNMWFGLGSNAVCKAGETHSKEGSPNYKLSHDPGAGQFGWHRCGRCQCLFLEAAAAQKPCHAGGAHTSTGTKVYRLIPVSKTIRLHVKVLTPPHVALETMMHNMREIYGGGGFDIEWLSTEKLDLPHFSDIDVGACNGQVTDEQQELFGNRNNVGQKELAIYMVETTFQFYDGCATHPPSAPGVIVAQTASQWALAHEIGHVLGLEHVDAYQRLMTRHGTENVIDPPPDLVASEFATMSASPLAVAV
jgi:hypothetical protein